MSSSLNIFSISSKHIELNIPAGFSWISKNELTIRLSYPDSLNINMNLSGYSENFTLFGKVSSKINLLPVQDYHLNCYKNLLASNNCGEAVPSILEKSGISNNYHIYHSGLEPFIQFLITHPYIIIVFFPIISCVFSSSMLRFTNIGLGVWKMLSPFFKNYPRFLTLPVLPSGLPIIFRYHNMDMWWYIIAKLLGLFDIYKSLLVKYIKGLAANLEAKLYIAHFNRIMDSYLYNEKIKISLNLVKKSIKNTNRDKESWASYISKSGSNIIDLCSISLVSDIRSNPLCLPDEIRKMIQEYILMSEYRELISEYIQTHYKYAADGNQIYAEINDWIRFYLDEQMGIHSGLNRTDLNLSRIEALGNQEEDGWYLYEHDMNHLIVLTENLSDIWEEMDRLSEKAISWGYPLLAAEFQEHVYLRLQLPFYFVDTDTFFNSWIREGFNF